jgi:hypothetical protein
MPLPGVIRATSKKVPVKPNKIPIFLVFGKPVICDVLGPVPGVDVMGKRSQGLLNVGESPFALGPLAGALLPSLSSPR